MSQLFITPHVIDQMRFENATVGFENRDGVVQNFSLNLPTQKVVRITGARGVGKSCMLRMIAGLQTPASGSYFINEVEVSNMSFEEFLYFRLLIGYSFDFGGLIHNMSLSQNLSLPLKYHRVAEDWVIEDRVEWYLRYFDLWSERDQRPSFVSGSMRKECCVLRSFILEPELLVLDSPTVGMNKKNVRRLKDLIIDKQGVSNLKHVFIASDDDEFLDGFIDETIDMDDFLQINQRIA